MDALGPPLSSVLESTENEAYEDALTSLSLLSNAAKRTTNPNDLLTGKELVQFAGQRLESSVLGKLKKTCKEMRLAARDGRVADPRQALRLAGVAVGVTMLVEASEDSKQKQPKMMIQRDTNQPQTASDLVGELLLVNLTVEAAMMETQVEAHWMLQKKNKSVMKKAVVVVDSDGVFLDAVTQIADKMEMYVGLVCDSAVFRVEGDAFVDSLIWEMGKEAGARVVSILKMLWETRDLPHMLRTAKRLGGLTLPRALKEQPKQQQQQLELSQKEEVELDCIVHDLSVVIRACERIVLTVKQACSSSNPAARFGELEAESAACVSALVALDELWLTHNVTKAVRHAVSLEFTMMMDRRIKVNSVAEDVFHVVNVCFARAVHSTSRLAAEATANVVSRFLGDGFLHLLRDVLLGDSSLQHQQQQKNGTAATTEAVTKGEDVNELINALDRLVSSPKSVGGGDPWKIKAEGLNTVEAAVAFLGEFESVVTQAFTNVFGCADQDVMASEILREAKEQAQSLLQSECSRRGDTLYESKRSGILRVLRDALDPRGGPYEMGVAAYEASGLDRPWIRAVVTAAFSGVENLKNCCATSVMNFISNAFCAHWVVDIESSLEFLRFSALGALRFETDVRALCESSVHELSSSDIRVHFRRLRHWSFLLNLDRAVDVDSIPFPSPALNKDEIAKVLSKRVEKEFFSSSS